MNKLLQAILTLVVVTAFAVGCGGKDSKTHKAQSGDLETRFANLEKRVAQLERGGGGGPGGMGMGRNNANPFADYIQTNPKDVAENPSSFNNQKIRLGAKIISLDLANNSMVMGRGDSEVKVDLSGLAEPFKIQLKNVDLNAETPERVVVMGVVKDGVLVAERVRVMSGMMGGGEGVPGGQGRGPGAMGGGMRRGGAGRFGQDSNGDNDQPR